MPIKLAGKLDSATGEWREAPVRASISRNPAIMGGAYCISGTRIPATLIQSFHRAGHSVAAIRKEYPTLTPEQIEAAISFRERKKPAPAETETGSPL